MNRTSMLAAALTCSALALACEDEPARTPRDAGDAFADDSATDAGNVDASTPSTACAAGDATFWKVLEIDGNWVEFFPTLRATKEGADLAFLGELKDAVAGTMIQGDAPEDMYFEVVLHAEISELLGGEPESEPIEITMVLPRAITPDARDEALRVLQDCLPETPVLFMLRQRESGQYRVINGYAVWAETARAKLDAPLQPDPPDTEHLFADELEPHDSIEELASSLR